MEKFWDGVGVHLAKANPRHDGRSLELAMTPSAADALRAALQKGAIAYALWDSEVMEILEALTYVTTNTQRGEDFHRLMLERKGAKRVTAPDHRYVPDPDNPGRCRHHVAGEGDDAKGGFCGLPRRRHEPTRGEPGQGDDPFGNWNAGVPG